jgi:hypothetical protein
MFGKSCWTFWREIGANEFKTNSWEEFNRRVGQEAYPIVYFDYDVFIPDD